MFSNLQKSEGGAENPKRIVDVQQILKRLDCASEVDGRMSKAVLQTQIDLSTCNKAQSSPVGRIASISSIPDFFDM